MKKVLFLFGVLTLMFAATQSANAYEPWVMSIYNGTVEPADYAIPGAARGSRVGRASCRSVMGVVNWGDCSINSAMKNGRISVVKYADWERKWIVVYGVKTLVVYGN